MLLVHIILIRKQQKQKKCLTNTEYRNREVKVTLNIINVKQRIHLKLAQQKTSLSNT